MIANNVGQDMQGNQDIKHEKIELFLHCRGQKPKKVIATQDEHLIDVLGKAEIETSDALVFIGESAEALKEEIDVDDGEDAHEPVDPNLTVRKLKLRPHDHVHCNKCRRIAVEVNYGKKSKQHKFSPATTVEIVTHWAKKKFKLDDAAADLVLQKCDTDHDRPRANQHLGELVGAVSCSICFNLVNEVTPQG